MFYLRLQTSHFECLNHRFFISPVFGSDCELVAPGMSSAAFLNSKEKRLMCLFHIESTTSPFLTIHGFLEYIFQHLHLASCAPVLLSPQGLCFLELQHVLLVANYFLGLTTTLPHTSPFIKKSENMSSFIFDFWCCDRFRLDWWYKKDRGLKSCLILEGVRTSDFLSPFEIPAWKVERVWDVHLDSFLSKH